MGQAQANCTNFQCIDFPSKAHLLLEKIAVDELPGMCMVFFLGVPQIDAMWHTGHKGFYDDGPPGVAPRRPAALPPPSPATQPGPRRSGLHVLLHGAGPRPGPVRGATPPAPPPGVWGCNAEIKFWLEPRRQRVFPG